MTVWGDGHGGGGGDCGAVGVAIVGGGDGGRDCSGKIRLHHYNSYISQLLSLYITLNIYILSLIISILI